MAALGSNMKGRKGKPEEVAKKKEVRRDSTPGKKAVKLNVGPSASTNISTKDKKLVKAKTTPAKAKKQLKAKEKVTAVPKAKKPVKAEEVKPKEIVSAQPQEKNRELKPALRAAQFIIEPSKRRKIRKTKVIMEGELTINNVDTFMELITPVFKEYDFVDFFLREVTSLDLSHMQMLYYYQNHHIKKGKTVTIDADIKPDLKKIIVSAGFKELMFIPKLV